MVALVLGAACLSAVNLSALGYACSEDSDCAGQGVCGNGHCVLADSGSSTGPVLTRLLNAQSGLELMLVDPRAVAQARDAGFAPLGNNGHDALCGVALSGDGGEPIPVYVLFRDTTGDALYSADPTEFPGAATQGYDGGAWVRPFNSSRCPLPLPATAWST